MKKGFSLRRIAFLFVILVLVLVIIYSGLQILESTVFDKGQNGETTTTSKTITRDGIEYFPRQDITTVMLIGVDQEGPVEASGSYVNDGSADMIAIMIFNETDESCNVLCLNRDTMLEMPILGIGGRKAGTLYGQLALSHTYGSGLEDSCENVRETVSDFLYGIDIDYYLAMNMDAIGILNDAVGGVTVTVEDDFSAVDPEITKGEFTLIGDQAMTFVRSRKGVGNQLNISRMKRQEEYIYSFINAFRKSVDEKDSFAITIYDKVSDYIVTDCSMNSFTGMIDRYSDYAIEEIVSPEGELVLGKEFYEFYVDEEELDELILDLLYAPKN